MITCTGLTALALSMVCSPVVVVIAAEHRPSETIYQNERK